VTAHTGRRRDHGRAPPRAGGLAPLEGVQFHPESILTEHGHAMLRNFLRMGEAPAELNPEDARTGCPSPTPKR
jgi:hypothetical protein